MASTEAICSFMMHIIRVPLMLSCLRTWSTRPGFPTPIGVLRAWDVVPRYEDVANQLTGLVIAKRGQGDLNELLRAGDTWEVK